MTNNTIAIHEAFVSSILNKNEDWKTLIQEDIYSKGPLAEVQTKEDFITLNEQYFEAIQDLEVKELLVNDNHIATKITTTIKKDDGSTTTFDASEWFEFKEGKIQALQIYFDPKPLM